MRDVLDVELDVKCRKLKSKNYKKINEAKESKTRLLVSDNQDHQCLPGQMHMFETNCCSNSESFLIS